MTEALYVALGIAILVAALAFAEIALAWGRPR